MKLLFLFLFLLVTAPKTEAEKITIKLEYEIISKSILQKDTIYFCKNKTRIRITTDTIYIYGKHQYLKIKK